MSTSAQNGATIGGTDADGNPEGPGEPGRHLRAELGEAEAGQAPVQHPPWIVHLSVPQHVYYRRRHVAVPPPPRGTKIRINEFAPGHLDARGLQSPVHRTASVDYGIVLQGEITLILDDSEVTLSAGDIVVQRGTDHAWANRGAGEMSVWLSKAGYEIGDIGPAGGLIFYENPNYPTDGWRYLEAAPFDQRSGAKWGCFRKTTSGARGTAVGTGKQNTQEMLTACSDPDTAAHLCVNLSLNGVSGWFLPSRDELALLYRNLHAKGMGGFLDHGFAAGVDEQREAARILDPGGQKPPADQPKRRPAGPA